MNDLEIMPREVKQMLDRGDKLLLVDVREPHEHAICNYRRGGVNSHADDSRESPAVGPG